MQRYPQTYLQELKEFIHDFESMLSPMAHLRSNFPRLHLEKSIQ